MLYPHVPYHNDTIIKQTQEDFFTNICTSHFICKGSKMLCGVLLWEGAGDRTETVIFWPPLLWPSTLCLSRSLDAQPEALGVHSAGCWLSLLHLISIFSGPQLIRAPNPFGLMWLSLPHLVYLHLQLYCNSNSTVVLTALYNSSTSTRSPTRSLKSNV